MVKIMKKIITFLYLIGLGLFSSVCQGQESICVKKEVFLKDFYFEYLTKTNIDEYDSKDVELNYQKIMNFYCTKELVSEIKRMRESNQLSYDPFIKAQDYHISILDFILIKKDPIRKGNYLMSYRYKNQNESERIFIDIQLMKINGSFKITGIDNIN